jgi:hypothetical protein
VEKLVGHSRCEDGGLLTDAVLEGWLSWVWTEHHVKTANITDVSTFDSKQRVISTPQPSVTFTILTQWYTQTSKEHELPRNLTSLAPPQTCQQKSNDYMNPHITTHYQSALKSPWRSSMQH